jgi:hypothetical protein
MQVVSLVRVIRKAKTNRALHDEFKKIDLNARAEEANNTLNFIDMHKVEEQVRDRISKHQFSEDSDR